MKSNYGRCFLVAFPIAAALASFDARTIPQTVAVQDLQPTLENRRATRLIVHLISNFHYKRQTLDDSLSKQILDRYLDALDPMRSYFVQTDIDEFARHNTHFDDYLLDSQLDPVFAIFVRYRERVSDRSNYAISLLDSAFDFTIDESFEFDREHAPWAASREELDELWRKRVKNDNLSLKLSGKSADAIKETLTKRYAELERRTEQRNSEDVFQVFINAYTTSIDPHTAYFSPRTSENFKIRMSLSLEGIGAVLEADDEFTVVREIVAGGPADKSGALHPGDRIVGIGQGAEEEIADVIGWRLDDVVDLIRGPKGSLVRLAILSKGTGPEGPTATISLVRNEIKLEEQAAKLQLHDVATATGMKPIAVITIPAFYMDFDARTRGDQDYRSTTRDVRKLIDEIKAKNADGLVIDLRGNGGGSLSEATELTGLFIDRGPVVQVRNSSGNVQLERDSDPGVVYDGPLAVLVDRNSASASEIFAGAIQDYQRGLIIGEPTFGKGTVQNLVDLNRFDKDMNGQLGQLKETIAQFFRVRGGSTQHRGVVPDILMPTATVSAEQGERGLDNALPWAEIEPARFTPVNAVHSVLDRLRAQHEDRIHDDPAFATLVEAERAIAEAQEKSEVSLIEADRRLERDRTLREQRERENRLRVARGLDPLPMDVATSDDEDTEAEPELSQREQDAYDVILDEAARILSDFTALTVLPKRLVDVDRGTGSLLTN